MTITQDKFNSDITVSVLTMDGHNSIVLFYQIKDSVETLVTGSVVTSSTITFTPTVDGLYRVYQYDRLPADLPTDRTATSLEASVAQISPTEIKEFIHIYFLNAIYVDTTKKIFEELLLGNDSQNNRQLQDVLDIGIITIQNLVTESYMNEAARIISLLTPLTSNIISNE